MPELPEVEITKQGVISHVLGKTITSVIIRQRILRKPIPNELSDALIGTQIKSLNRRSKYLIFDCTLGLMIIHLGMSGSLRIMLPESTQNTLLQKHDHIDWLFSDGTIMRYKDPRRFGLIDWFYGAPEHYPPFQKLGLEPLNDEFHADFLFQQLQKKKQNIKTVLMQGSVVVGVGNIYANEALFYAGIHPKTLANTLTQADCIRLKQSICDVLQAAIRMGGSSLKDFVHSDGGGGYFQQHYAVYGRENEPCIQCTHPIEKININARSSFLCPQCQKEFK